MTRIRTQYLIWCGFLLAYVGVMGDLILADTPAAQVRSVIFIFAAVFLAGTAMIGAGKISERRLPRW